MISLPCGKSELHFAHLSSKWTQGSHLVLGGINESPGYCFKIMKLNVQFFFLKGFHVCMYFDCLLKVYLYHFARTTLKEKLVSLHVLLKATLQIQEYYPFF
jgi:hypothetical protein